MTYRITALAALTLTLSLARPGLGDPSTTPAVRLVHRPHLASHYTVKDEERVVRSANIPGSKPFHAREDNRYVFEKTFSRWVEAAGKSGLRVHLKLEKSTMTMDGKSIPVELDGRPSSDLLRRDGTLELGGQGHLEDPARLDVPFPDREIKVGDRWEATTPSSDGINLPVSHRIEVRSPRPDSGTGRLTLHVESRRSGAVPDRDFRLNWRQSSIAEFELASGALVRLRQETRWDEAHPAQGPATQTVLRTASRWVKRAE